MQRPAKFRRRPFAHLCTKPTQVRLGPLTLVTVTPADRAWEQTKASNNSLGEVVENDGEVKFGLELDLSVETVTSIPMAPQNRLAPGRHNTNIIRRIIYPRGRVLGFSDGFGGELRRGILIAQRPRPTKPPDHEHSRVLQWPHQFLHISFGSIYNRHLIGFCSKLLSFEISPETCQRWSKELIADAITTSAPSAKIGVPSSSRATRQADPVHGL